MADSRVTLKAFFETGDIPTQIQFAALIDSLVSLVDADTITGEKTFDSDIFLSDTRVIKAVSGGGQLNLREAGVDSNVGLTPDNGAFTQGFFFAETTSSSIGFSSGDVGPNSGSDVLCRANEVRIATGIATGGFDNRIQVIENKIGIFGAVPVLKQTVTGSRGGNAALANFLTAIANFGWIIDNSTA